VMAQHLLRAHLLRAHLVLSQSSKPRTDLEQTLSLRNL